MAQRKVFATHGRLGIKIIVDRKKKTWKPTNWRTEASLLSSGKPLRVAPHATEGKQ